MKIQSILKITSSLCLCVCFSILSQAQSYTGIEAIEYDPINGRFLVSNGNTIISRAPNGGLSFFGDGARFNYGMEVIGENIFGIHNGTIRGYNLNTEEEVMNESIPSTFMNGMATDGQNMLWITDFSAKKIYSLDLSDIDNPVLDEIASGLGESPNGIVYDEENNRCVFVNWGNSAPIKAIDLTSFEVTIVTATSLGNCDGIDMDNDGNYYVSSWNPTRISKFSNDFQGSPETITVADGLSSPADICYALPIDTLAIPNSGDNTVSFVGFSTTDLREINLEELQLTASFKDSYLRVNFNLTQASKLELDLLDSNGRVIEKLSRDHFPIGKNEYLYPVSNLNSGIYIVTFKDGSMNSSVSLYIH